MTDKDFSDVAFSKALLQMQEAQEPQEEQDKQEKQRKPRKKYTQEEAAEFLAQGRKSRGMGGVKAPRINMAFTPQNYAFINVLSRVSGMTITDFTNKLIDKAREENQEIYDQALEFQKRFD